MPKDPNYPAMKWHPDTAEARVFTALEDVPAGWLDTHPSNLPPKDAEPEQQAAKDAASNAGEPPMTRAEIKAALDKLQVQYAKNAGDAKLYVLLDEAVREDMVAAGVDVTPGLTVPMMLAILLEPPVAE